MGRKLAKLLLAAVLLGSPLPGCQGLTARQIQVGTLKLPAGSTVLLCEAIQGFIAYDIRNFRRHVDIPGITIAGPAAPAANVFSLDSFVKDAVRERPCSTVLVVSPYTSRERGYRPYSVITGYTERVIRIRDENGVRRYDTIREPVIETRYVFSCTRMTYRIYQYDREGNPMGTAHIESTRFQPCPESSDEDVHFDDIEYVLAWFRSHIAAK